MIPRANVYDLRNLTPSNDFFYFFDTNVLKFIFVRTLVNEEVYQTRDYPAFYKQLMQNKCELFTSVHTITELLGLIDSLESKQLNRRIKEYRSEDLEAYQEMRKEILSDIQSKIQVMESPVKLEMIHNYLNLDYSLDVGDYLLNCCFARENLAIISDDREFMYIDGLNFFTANGNAIDRASRFKKLM